MNDPRIITIETCTANATAASTAINIAKPATKRSIADRIVDFMLSCKENRLQKQLKFHREKLQSIPQTADAFKHAAQLDYGVRLGEIDKWRVQAAAECRHKIAVLKADLEKSEAAK